MIDKILWGYRSSNSNSPNGSPWKYLKWYTAIPYHDRSTLVQVMAWCRQATSHYLSQSRPRSVLPYCITKLQCVVNHGHVQFILGNTRTEFHPVERQLIKSHTLNFQSDILKILTILCISLAWFTRSTQPVLMRVRSTLMLSTSTCVPSGLSTSTSTEIRYEY